MLDAPPAGLTLYPNAHEYNGNAWALSIDLNRCNGCNACVVACQAENNIPVVGKEQVMAGREMHWIRIDRYYEGEPATIRRPISSRCRACSARTRRANWFVPWRDEPQRRRTERHGVQPLCRHALLLEQLPVQSAPLQFPAVLRLGHAERLKLLRNPDVTVRSRGVMEKCTYCVQRITNARRSTRTKQDRHGARRRNRHGVPAGVSGGGDRFRQYERSEQPRGRELKAEPRNYGLLAELEHAAADDVSGARAQSQSRSLREREEADGA